MSILFAIILFSFLVFIHELGHFVCAKMSGIQVNEFALFMGPAIFKKQVGETLYSIRCIPIGGYCAMEGEDEDSENPRSFQKAAWWKRLIVLVAGAAMNFVAGVLLFAVVYAPTQKVILPVIDFFEEGCVLQSEEGLQPGDRLLKVDGERIYLASNFTTLLSLNSGDVHDILVERDGQKVLLDDFHLVKAEFPNEDGSTSLRYGFSFRVGSLSFFQKLGFIWDNVVDNVRMVRLSLQMLLRGQAGLMDMTGPVGIVQIMSETAAQSATTQDAIYNLLYLGGFIAFHLAVMNLLPIPALDGGRVVCLLLALMAVVMFKDIFVIFKG